MWCPHAKAIPFEHPDGGSFLDAPARGILHTTESDHYTPSTTDYYGHRNPPHVTVDRNGQAWQHYPANRAARALRHPRGTMDTNRMNCFQIEIVGYARNIHLMPAPQVVKVREVMRWAERVRGIRRAMPLEFRGSEAYGEDSPYRMKDRDWARFDAWGGHQHVGSKNSHWDPGKLDPQLLLNLDVWSKPGDPVITGEDAVRVALYQGGQEQARIVEEVIQEEAQIMFGRTLDLLMQHDLRLKELE